MYNQAFNRDVVDAFRERDVNSTGIFHSYSEGKAEEVIGVKPERLAQLYRVKAAVDQLVHAIDTGAVDLKPNTIEGQLVCDEFRRITSEVLVG